MIKASVVKEIRIKVMKKSIKMMKMSRMSKIYQ